MTRSNTTSTLPTSRPGHGSYGPRDRIRDPPTEWVNGRVGRNPRTPLGRSTTPAGDLGSCSRVWFDCPGPRRTRAQTKEGRSGLPPETPSFAGLQRRVGEGHEPVVHAPLLPDGALRLPACPPYLPSRLPSVVSPPEPPALRTVCADVSEPLESRLPYRTPGPAPRPRPGSLSRRPLFPNCPTSAPFLPQFLRRRSRSPPFLSRV